MGPKAKASDHRAQELNPRKPMALARLPDRPLVSVLISNYNYGQYLIEAIESVLGQTYSNLELIICDDGSTDDSPSILQRYQAMDSRIKVVRQPNGGQSHALNSAFRECTGEIICLLDADDVFLPNKLGLVVGALIAAPGSGFVANRMLLVDHSRRPLAQIPSLYELPSGWRGGFPDRNGPRIVPGLPPTSGLSLHRSVAQTLFPLPAELRAYSDTSIQAIAPLITSIVSISVPLSEYRVHGVNVAAVSRFTEERLRNIVLYESEIWRFWRRLVVSSGPGGASLFVPPQKRAPSVMDYAYARIRGDRNFKSVYGAIPAGYFSLLPNPLRWYWRVSPMLPGWLFQSSFNFVYGHTRIKTIARRVLTAWRNSVGLLRLTRFVRRVVTRQAAIEPYSQAEQRCFANAPESPSVKN
jgi:glycosyltransferase involved in cell wall biosynthesis